MAVITPADIVTRAELIKNETSTSANTATRVGSWMRDSWDTMIDKLGSVVSGDAFTNAISAINTAIGLKADATALADYVPISQKGSADGVAPLDADSKVPYFNLPELSPEFWFRKKSNFVNTDNTGTLINVIGGGVDVFGYYFFKPNTLKKGKKYIGRLRWTKSATVSVVNSRLSFSIGSLTQDCNITIASSVAFDVEIKWVVYVTTEGVNGVLNWEFYYNNQVFKFTKNVDTTTQVLFSIRSQNPPFAGQTVIISGLQMQEDSSFVTWDKILGNLQDSILQTELTTLQTQIDNINTLLQSNDVDLDNVQELVDAIKTVQTSLATILVNDLTTGGTTKALTAQQGVVLKGLIDAIVPQPPLVNVDDAAFALKDGNNIIKLDWNAFGGVRMYDASQELSLDIGAKALYNSNTLSLDWLSRILYDLLGNPAINYSNGIIIYHSSGNQSINAEARVLKDSNGNNTLSWEDKQLYDANNIDSLSWESRALTDSTTFNVYNWDENKFYKGIGIGELPSGDSSITFGQSTAASHGANTLFVESGALKFKGGSGTVTTIAPA